MVVEEIKVKRDDAAQMSCFIFRSVREPECRPWNPTIDSGVLNYSMLYENGGLWPGQLRYPIILMVVLQKLMNGLSGPVGNGRARTVHQIVWRQ